NLGLRALYTKAVTGSDNPETETLMSEQLGLRLMLGAAVGIIATSAAALLHSDSHTVVLCTAIQAFGVILTISWTAMADVLNARERFAQNARIAFLAGLSLTMATVAAAAIGGGPVSVAAGFLVGPLVSLLLLVSSVRKMGITPRVGGTTWDRYGQMLRQARALAANDLVTALNSRAMGIWSPILFAKPLIGINDSGTLPYSRLGQISEIGRAHV